MSTLEFILKKYNITFDDSTRMPIEIPDVGRKQFTMVLAELNFKVAVEVGVCDGIYSEVIARNNPQIRLYSVDPWQPLEDYKDYQLQSTFTKMYAGAKERLEKYPNCQMVRKTSMEAVKDFADESVDFVYIDANHKFEFVIEDLAHWSKKLKRGGIMAGHDYINSVNKNIQVLKAVHTWTNVYKIRPWFVLGTNEMVTGRIRDRSRSWMWIKA